MGMFRETFTIRANRVAPPVDIDGIRVLFVTVRNKDGARAEPAQFGSMRIQCGGLMLESAGQREAMEATHGYSAAVEDRDKPGGQDTGVWVYSIPKGTTGRIAIESDWVWQLHQGTVELMGID